MCSYVFLKLCSLPFKLISILNVHIILFLCYITEHSYVSLSIFLSLRKTFSPYSCVVPSAAGPVTSGVGVTGATSVSVASPVSTVCGSLATSSVSGASSRLARFSRSLPSSSPPSSSLVRFAPPAAGEGCECGALLTVQAHHTWGVQAHQAIPSLRA